MSGDCSWGGCKVSGEVGVGVVVRLVVASVRACACVGGVRCAVVCALVVLGMVVVCGGLTADVDCRKRAPPAVP